MFVVVGFGFKLFEDWFEEDLFSCKHNVQKVIIPSKESSVKFEEKPRATSSNALKPFTKVNKCFKLYIE